jgi:hypothetical protein
MRGPIPWVLVAVGVVVLIAVGGALADRDEGETVPAGEWAQSVCGAVGVWRGNLGEIVDDLRDPNAAAAIGEEPQSETPQGRSGFIRDGLQRALDVTEIMVEGVDNAGVPDTPEGEEGAERVSEWAGEAQETIEDAQDSLDDEADSLDAALEQLTDAARTIAAVYASGAQTIVEVTRLDSELGAALSEASTCQELREDEEGER